MKSLFKLFLIVFLLSFSVTHAMQAMHMRSSEKENSDHNKQIMSSPGKKSGLVLSSLGKENCDPKPNKQIVGSPSKKAGSPKKAEQARRNQKDAKDAKETKKEVQADSNAQRRAQLLEIFTDANHEELEFQTANMLYRLLVAEDVSLKNVNVVIKMLKQGVFADPRTLWAWFWYIIPQHNIETLERVVEVLHPYFPSTEKRPETLLGILVTAITHEEIWGGEGYDLNTVCDTAKVYYWLIKKLMSLDVKYVPYVDNHLYTGLSVEESHDAMRKDLSNLSGQCPKPHYVDYIVEVFKEDMIYGFLN